MRKERRPGRAKEFPYYRIQYWDEFSICWVYLSKVFTDPGTAENFAVTVGKRYRIGSKYRIMEIAKDGQKPVRASG